jgi:hypothetical protein
VLANELPDGIWFGFAATRRHSHATWLLLARRGGGRGAIADDAKSLLPCGAGRLEPWQDAGGTAYWLDVAAANRPLAIPMIDWPVIVGAACQECQ